MLTGVDHLGNFTLLDSDACTSPLITFPLSNLAEGSSAWVVELLHQSAIRQRLLDIGLTPGTKVECLFKSPLGDPIAYDIRGAVMALRSEDAAEVWVKNS